MVKKIILAFIFLLFLILPVSADVVTHEWTAVTESGVTIGAGDMSATGNTIVVGNDNGLIICFNGDGDELWNVSGFANPVEEILYPPSGEFVAARDSTDVVKIFFITNGTIKLTRADANILDFDITSDGELLALVQTTSFTIIDTDTNSTVGYRIINQNTNGETGNYGQIILDPNAEWISLLKTDASGTIQLYDFDDNSGTWLTNYTYRKGFKITGSSEGVLENYGVNVTIHRENGIDSGDDVYLGTLIQADYDDVRFTTQSDPSTELKYKIVGVPVGNTQLMSVIFDSLGKNEVKNLYIYYGNATIADDSTGDTYYYEDVGVMKPPINDADFEIGGSNWTYTEIEGGLSVVTQTLPSDTWYSNGTHSVYHMLDINRDGDRASAYAKITQSTSTSTGFGYTLHYDVRGVKTGPGVAAQTAYVSVCGEVTTITAANVVTNVTVDIDSGEGIIIQTFGDTMYSVNDMEVSAWIDNLTFTRNIVSFPTVGTWTAVETNYEYDTDYKTFTTVGSAVVLSDMAWTGDIFVVSTGNRLYQVSVTGSASYSSSYTSTVTDTPYVVKSGANANLIGEGRGNYLYIYRVTPVLDASWSHGNTVIATDVAEDNGLWTIDASSDNTVKIFSKTNSTTWYYVWGADVASDASNVMFSATGGHFTYTLDSDGILYYYSTYATTDIIPDVYVTFHVFKDGIPYEDALVDVYFGGPYGGSYNIVESDKFTDSYGEFKLFAISGYYYRIDIKNPDTDEIEATQILQIGRTNYDYNVNIYIGIQQYGEDITHQVSYNATYDEDSGEIFVGYYDPDDITSKIIVTIVKSDIHNNVTDFYTNTWYVEEEIFENITASSDYSYVVTITFTRAGVDYTEQFSLVPRDKYSVEFPIPPIVRAGAFAILILVIVEMFPPRFAGLAAVSSAGFLVFFNLIGALIMDWLWVSIIAVVAVMYLIGRIMEGKL